MTDLLVVAAADLSGGDWFAAISDRIANSLMPGKAGNVASARVAGAYLATRANDFAPNGQKPRVCRLQPASTPDGAYVLLAGRIMERAELAATIGIAAPLRDAGLYAAAWARWGDHCDRHIVGDYAAIVWSPDKRCLRLARSPTSSAPLHVWREGDRVVAGSLPRALFAAGAPDRINSAKLADSMLLNMRDGQSSWYQDLQCVPCGTIVHHDRAGSRVKRFWSIDAVKPVRFRRDSDYVEAVDEQFHRAIRATLEGVKVPGIMLSGGLDSQAVATYATQHLEPGTRLRAYTAVPMRGWTPPPRPRIFGDESAHVAALAAMYPQIDPQFIDAASRHYGDRIDAMFFLASWPTHNEMNMHWIYEAMAGAADAGCDVMLTGDAGNMGFSFDGSTGFPTWLKQGRLGRLAREVALSDDPRPYWRKLVSLSFMPHVPVKLRRLIDRKRPWRPSPFVRWCPLREDFARRSGAMARADMAGHDVDFYDYASALQWRRDVLASLSCNTPEINLGLRLLHGPEMRDPTAFVPLLELCAGIPDDQYLRNGVDRWLARRLLKGRVPESVRNERRAGAQACDWPLRFIRDRETIMAEMAQMQADDQLAEMFDFGRMMDDLQGWPGSDVPQDRWNERINLAIGRGVATARFVRYVEGRNVG
ncbi:MAG: asparagine synthetase B family protein [Caenibius sp.]